MTLDCENSLYSWFQQTSTSCYYICSQWSLGRWDLVALALLGLHRIHSASRYSSPEQSPACFFFPIEVFCVLLMDFQVPSTAFLSLNLIPVP